jgi:hypothetical protein
MRRADLFISVNPSPPSRDDVRADRLRYLQRRLGRLRLGLVRLQHGSMRACIGLLVRSGAPTNERTSSAATRDARAAAAAAAAAGSTSAATHSLFCDLGTPLPRRTATRSSEIHLEWQAQMRGELASSRKRHAATRRSTHAAARSGTHGAAHGDKGRHRLAWLRMYALSGIACSDVCTTIVTPDLPG